jgi:hypothetical protein
LEERKRGVEWFLVHVFSEMLEEEYGMENLPEILANTIYFLQTKAK